jgi:VCBS repeat protein
MKIKGLSLFAFATIFLSIFTLSIAADPIVREASGATPASIQAAVDQFRADLGALNPNARQTFSTGRRELNWDGVPEGSSVPNSLLPDFFNFNSPRGVMFTSTTGPDLRGVIAQPFLVSSSVASGVPLRFGNINPTYTNEFEAFSEQKIFAPTPGSNVIEVTFFIPGTNIPATVSGFGAVFCDADTPATHMQFYDQNGRILLQPGDPVVGPDKGLAFQGVSFHDGTRIARVVMVLGNAPLSLTNTDGINGADVVAVDDLIYGEPHALEHHSADFDGDGAPDLSIFRPPTGQWFILNSGSNTVRITQFGLDGDIPVDADFDGDGRSDIALFRPSTGTWFSLKSSNGQFSAIHFGLADDEPVPGDYDKDGRSDIAVWRPSIGDFFILKSSTGQASETHWGLKGDIPIGSAK